MYSVSRFVNLQHRRKSFRLKNYDYTKPGLYYLTLCCQERAHLFGTIEESQMQLNPAGKMVAEQWELLPQRFPNVRLHDFVVMPNHFHGILEIVENGDFSTSIVDSLAYKSTDSVYDSAGVGAALVAALSNKPNNYYTEEPDMGYLIEERAATLAAPTPSKHGEPSVNSIIGAFKSITTVEYIKGVKHQSWPTFNKKVWQRNYWERVIRTQPEYEIVRSYTCTNPACWKSDCFSD